MICKSALTVVFLASCAIAVFGCQCEIVPECVYFTNATKVFSGTVESSNVTKRSDVVRVRFKILKSYKGTTGEFETVEYLRSACRPEFESGAEYIVFDDGVGPQSSCNPTKKQEKTSTLPGIAEFAGSEPTVYLAGRIVGFSVNEARTARLFWEPEGNPFGYGAGGTYWIQFPAFGQYVSRLEFELDRIAVVKVRSFTSAGGRYSVRNDGNRFTVTFESNFRSNGCDAREIRIEEP